ncbi:hypothetical protein JHN49_13695, partial [Streptomyces sp. MBT57]|nr:hypothetical protein [Streptomyces sp. MBT57]
AWDAEGSCRIPTLRRIGLEPPEGPYETVAGLVADLLGRIPAPGDLAELPGWRISVHRVGHYRAERVRFTRIPGPQEPVRAPLKASAHGAPDASAPALLEAAR